MDLEGKDKMNDLNIPCNEGGIDYYYDNFHDGKSYNELMKTDIEDMGLTRAATRTLLLAGIFSIEDYTNRFGDIRCKYKKFDAFLSGKDLTKGESDIWGFLNAEIELMQKLFKAGFWNKCIGERTHFPTDSLAVTFIPFSELGYHRSGCRILERAGFSRVIDLYEEEKVNNTSKNVEDTISSLLLYMVNKKYISEGFMEQIVAKRVSMMNPNKINCREYRGALVDIKIANNFQHKDFRCSECNCEGTCAALDDEVRDLVRQITAVESSGRKVRFSQLLLKDLMHLCDDIKRLGL